MPRRKTVGNKFLLLPVSGAESGISSMPEIPNDNRQPEITAVLTFSHRHARGRLGDFVAEIPHKVLSGVINVQRRHRFLVSYGSRSAWRLAACPAPLPDGEWCHDLIYGWTRHALKETARRPAKSMAGKS